MSTLAAPQHQHVPAYKGKVTHRSWPQLPDELVRHIATFYIWDLAATSYCPQTWDTREFWHPRMVYTALRDAAELERTFMSICPQWSLALETHLFWQQAIALIDPVDSLAHHAVIHPKPVNPTTHTSAAAPPPIRLTPYRHFRNITGCSCFVCRINAPTTTMGLTSAKRTVSTPFLGHVALCREHDRRRGAFCGLCLREAPVFETATNPPQIAADLLVACMENEDEETWRGVEATCRQCRSEWLWRRVCNNTRDREAIGGASMVSEDWETRQCVDGFLDLAEGSINDVIVLAREKWWLRKNTRIGDMLQQALAAARFNSGSARAGGGGRQGDYESLDVESVEEEEEEEDEDEDEDTELMQLTEEGGVRDLALGDWARARILDGYWISPADIWYGNTVPGHPLNVQAVHPCSWTQERPIQNSDNGAAEELNQDQPHNDDIHPRDEIIRAEVPPSYALCEQAYIAHSRQMRVVLLPALRNVVRRIVLECTFRENAPRETSETRVVREDPAMRAAKMTMEDVLRVLREEEGVWFDGIDWIEKWRNDDTSMQRRREEETVNQRSNQDTFNLQQEETLRANSIGKSSDGSPNASDRSSNASDRSSNSSDGSSNATSPVLSTTTLRTTPSPPPLSDEGQTEKKADAEYTSRVSIPVSPVLDPPRLLRPIPYVPVTAVHLPQYSLEAFRAVWREACAPLYHCRCKICERAMAANAASSPTGSTNSPTVVPSHQLSDTKTKLVTPISTPKKATREQDVLRQLDDPVMIQLREFEEVDDDGEDEADDFDRQTAGGEDAEEERDEDEVYAEEEQLSDEYEVYRYSSSPEPVPKLDRTTRKRSSDELEEQSHGNERRYSHGGGTPPKRLRRAESGSLEDVWQTRVESPRLESSADLPSLHQRKRSSQELEEGSGSPVGSKRVKVRSTLTAELQSTAVD